MHSYGSLTRPVYSKRIAWLSEIWEQIQPNILFQ